MGSVQHNQVNVFLIPFQNYFFWYAIYSILIWGNIYNNYTHFSSIIEFIENIPLIYPRSLYNLITH